MLAAISRCNNAMTPERRLYEALEAFAASKNATLDPQGAIAVPLANGDGIVVDLIYLKDSI